MVTELSSIFGTDSFIETAKEYGMDLSFGFSFRSLNIIPFAFSLRNGKPFHLIVMVKK